MNGRTVVKVGGSLLNFTDLRPRLCKWLERLDAKTILLVPGGGEAAELIRRMDRLHGLGDELGDKLGNEQAHWLAVRAMSLNAHLLAALLGDLLPDAILVDALPPPLVETEEGRGRVFVLDVLPLLLADERRPEHLPHTWSVTADSIAARIAQLAGADRLILLKACGIPTGATLEELAAAGIVDEWFPRLAGSLSVVRVVNLLEEMPSVA